MRGSGMAHSETMFQASKLLRHHPVEIGALKSALSLARSSNCRERPRYVNGSLQGNVVSEGFCQRGGSIWLPVALKGLIHLKLPTAFHHPWRCCHLIHGQRQSWGSHHQSWYPQPTLQLPSPPTPCTSHVLGTLHAFCMPRAMQTSGPSSVSMVPLAI